MDDAPAAQPVPSPTPWRLEPSASAGRVKIVDAAGKLVLGNVWPKLAARIVAAVNNEGLTTAMLKEGAATRAQLAEAVEVVRRIAPMLEYVALHGNTRGMFDGSDIQDLASSARAFLAKVKGGKG